MIPLRLQKKSFDRYIQKWYLFCFLIILIVPVVIGNIPFQNDNIKLLKLSEFTIEAVTLIISITQAIKVKRIILWEYKVLEVADTRKGVSIYISKYSHPIYVPLDWLSFDKSETKNQYTLKFTKAITFNSKGASSIIDGGEVVLSDKCLDFGEVTEHIDLLKNLQRSSNALLTNYNLCSSHLEQYSEKPYDLKSASFFPWVMIVVNLLVALFVIQIDSTMTNTDRTSYRSTKMEKPNHKMINYKRNMTIKIKDYNLKINHAYLVKSDSDVEYIILNIKAKVKGGYGLDAIYFSSYKKWTIDDEKNYNVLDIADTHPSFNVKINGEKKPVINILDNGWFTDDGYTPSLFNIILKKGTGNSTDILFDDLSSKSSKSSFVMTIKSKDLEKIE